MDVIRNKVSLPHFSLKKKTVFDATSILQLNIISFSHYYVAINLID